MTTTKLALHVSTLAFFSRPPPAAVSPRLRRDAAHRPRLPVALARARRAAVDIGLQLFARDAELAHHLRCFERASLFIRRRPQSLRHTFEGTPLRIISNLVGAGSRAFTRPQKERARARARTILATIAPSQHHLRASSAPPIDTLAAARIRYLIGSDGERVA